MNLPPRRPLEPHPPLNPDGSNCPECGIAWGEFGLETLAESGFLRAYRCGKCQYTWKLPPNES